MENATFDSLGMVNAVKDLLVEFATAHDIALVEEFETPKQFKNFVIAFTIKALVNFGASNEDACRMALGGAFDDMVSNVYHKLRA